MDVMYGFPPKDANIAIFRARLTAAEEASKKAKDVYLRVLQREIHPVCPPQMLSELSSESA